MMSTRSQENNIVPECGKSCLERNLGNPPLPPANRPRMKHIHGSGRIEDPEITIESERQFYEQLYHRVGYAGSPSSQIHPARDRNASKMSKLSKNGPAWTTSKKKSLSQVKPLSIKKEIQNTISKERIKVVYDEPFGYTGYDDHEKSGLPVPKWATNINFSSQSYGWPAFDNDNPEDKPASENKIINFSQDEENEQSNVPSWALQVTVNTLNEMVIFKDESLSSRPPPKLTSKKYQPSSMAGDNPYNNKTGNTKNKTTFISGQNISIENEVMPPQYSPNLRFNKINNSGNNCKGQELISSLMISPIETFEKLMTYLMTPGAIDEEDIIGVENFDECDNKPFPWTEGDNFLAFVKEKHLKQGINYCNLATRQLIKRHIKKIKMGKEQDSRNKKPPKIEENVVHLAQATGIKEVHEADDQIEVIGYVGCTGNKGTSKTKKNCLSSSDI